MRFLHVKLPLAIQIKSSRLFIACEDNPSNITPTHQYYYIVFHNSTIIKIFQSIIVRTKFIIELIVTNFIAK